ncbi:hypothetical protein [Caenimonas koreensis]|uniref:Translational machinery protein n=1 Tax=Caenimonas koreensis DSM 17982 TaxID=1121255 RepID=A0A844AZ00_9BURK|nr:hypothetical protein [Caenimonas koreensis]MRD49264.1 hypothetical protein [Caenimonas koreensis DSM 17982]
MTLQHAVAFVDHHNAQVVQFSAGADTAVEKKLHEHRHLTKQHGSSVRSEHEFFAHICDALEGIAEILVVGGHQGLADFRHYVDKHKPQTAARICDYQVVDHPSENELVALARKYFVKHDKMTGTLPVR